MFVGQIIETALAVNGAARLQIAFVEGELLDGERRDLEVDMRVQPSAGGAAAYRFSKAHQGDVRVEAPPLSPEAFALQRRADRLMQRAQVQAYSPRRPR